MIQGTSSGAGKSTLVAALCRIFSDDGYKVAPFKSQNMSNFSFIGNDFEISRAQAIQAIAARCKITPDLNPILLKPRGCYTSLVFVNGKKFKKMHAREYYQNFVLQKGLRIATASLERLKKSHDLVILEGAGSPAEINMQKFDIANMKIAMKSKSPVLLISDIDKGGSFASIAGTLSLLEKKHQNLVKGIIINKFQGDVEILKPGFQKLGLITKKPVLGIIPLIKMNLPEEDSLHSNPKPIKWNSQNIRKIEIEINKISKIVKKSLNMKKIEKMINDS